MYNDYSNVNGERQTDRQRDRQTETAETQRQRQRHSWVIKVTKLVCEEEIRNTIPSILCRSGALWV